MAVPKEPRVTLTAKRWQKLAKEAKAKKISLPQLVEELLKSFDAK